jgi:cytochrome c553
MARNSNRWYSAMAAATGLALLAAPALADYPSAKQAEIAHTAQYVGGDACQSCHSDVHNQWKTSWHTLKATQGPAQGKEFEKNIYEWVRRDWDKLESYQILDQKDKDTIYVGSKKVDWKEVDYVIGQVRKQRYMLYYDGGPREAWEARTENGGISWTIDKSKTVQFAGNKERAGYKFLFLEMNPKDGQFNKNYYGEYRSWQERCIGCHTTGFDYKAWDAAKADFAAGKRKDLRDLFVADLRVSCEMCHGPGSEHVKNPGAETIINPTKMTDATARQMVCGQCHTRPDKSVHGKTSQDLRGYRLGDKYEDFASFTRPNWTKGNRQVSIDGKGRRDHQQDMDIRLSATIKGSHSVHAEMACFDCHEAHGVGNNKENPRLKKSAVETCAACHGAKAEAVLKVLDGRKGWEKADYPNWATEYGRQPNKQHIFNFDDQGRSFGITPDQYHWALKKDGDAKKEADWAAIWPWEKATFEKKGQTVAIGAAPWN